MMMMRKVEGGGGGGSPKTNRKKSCKAKIEKNSCIAKEPEKNILQGQPMRLRV